MVRAAAPSNDGERRGHTVKTERTKRPRSSEGESDRQSSSGGKVKKRRKEKSSSSEVPRERTAVKKKKIRKSSSSSSAGRSVVNLSDLQSMGRR